ncbi:MAG: hypothetical protein E7638_06975 [Ruminococcaceae bacterium]|nr:hypothetical protein [Oscillospiraceae bacterium]
MREFLSENKDTIKKLMLNQFGAAFFGILITSAVTKTKWLMLFASCFATLFYLILIYNQIWERGGQDRIRVDGGRAAYKPHTGLLVSLCANALSILLGVCIIIGAALGTSHEWAGNMYAITNALSRLWNSMYIGIIQTYSPNNPIIHLLHIIPALLVTTLGYYLGFKNVRIFGFLTGGKKAK